MLAGFLVLGSAMATIEKVCIETAAVSFVGLIGATLMLFMS